MTSSPRRSSILLATDAEGRVLAVRQRGGPFKDAWLLPGGGLEPGETFDEALLREVREESGLDVKDPREICRYDVKGVGGSDLHLRVHMYRGTVQGEPRAGHDEEPVEWRRVDPSTAHPVLLRQLVDAGVLRIEPAEVEARCGELGIGLRIVPPDEVASPDWSG